MIIDISVFFSLEKLKKNFKNCLYLNIFLIKTINTIIIYYFYLSTYVVI